MLEAISQLDLPYTQPLPRATQSATSTAAANALAAPVTAAMERRVLAVLDSRGAYGATDAELQDELCIPVSTEVPRRNALMNRGLVFDSGRTRPTPSGRAATVWVSGRQFISNGAICAT